MKKHLYYPAFTSWENNLRRIFPFLILILLDYFPTPISRKMCPAGEGLNKTDFGRKSGKKIVQSILLWPLLVLTTTRALAKVADFTKKVSPER